MGSFCGYHANESERCRPFLQNKINLIVSIDREYLGNGMYFWDNKSNAKYWYFEKKERAKAKIL